MDLRASGLGLLFVAVSFTASFQSASAQYVLDDFESGKNRIVQPQATEFIYKYLWNLYSSGRGPVDVVSEDSHDGEYSLRARHASGSNFQFQLYTYTENLPGWDNGWKYLREFVNNNAMNPSGGSPAWSTGRINRLRFWVKLPPGYSQSGVNHNFEFGTYIREPGTAENVAESDNQHFYHFLDLRSHGEWEQVIIDTHPDHQRGNSGNTELPDSPQVGGAGYTYFDLMTRFYIDAPSSARTGDHYFDGFEFYEEVNPENTDQVRSIHGVYIPSSNSIEVGWRRPKDEDGIDHEVRYSFSSVHSIGWNSAIPAPNGTVVDRGNGGYNGMRWSTSSIDVSGHDVVYIAIKPQNSSLFRQIAVPTTSSPIAKPNAPKDVQVQ